MTTNTLATHYAINVPEAKHVIGLNEKTNWLTTVNQSALEFLKHDIHEIASVVLDEVQITLGARQLHHEDGERENLFFIKLDLIDAPINHSSEMHFLNKELVLPHYEFLEAFIIINAREVMRKNQSKFLQLVKFPIAEDVAVFTHRVDYQLEMAVSNKVLPIPQIDYDTPSLDNVARVIEFVETVDNHNNVKNFSGLYTFNSHTRAPYAVYSYWFYEISELYENEGEYNERQQAYMEESNRTVNRRTLPIRVAHSWFEFAIDIIGIRRDVMTMSDFNKVKKLISWMVNSPENVKSQATLYVNPDDHVTLQTINKAYKMLQTIFATLPGYEEGGN